MFTGVLDCRDAGMCSHFYVVLRLPSGRSVLSVRCLMSILWRNVVSFWLPSHVSPAYRASGSVPIPVALPDPSAEATPVDDVAALWPSREGVWLILIVAFPADYTRVLVRERCARSGVPPIAEACFYNTSQVGAKARFG